MPSQWVIYHGPDCTHHYCRQETRRRKRYGDAPRAAQKRPAIPRPVREAVIARDGLVCQLCGIAVVRRSTREPYQPDTLHLDHIELWGEGGKDTVENLRVACAACNLSRPKSSTSALSATQAQRIEAAAAYRDETRTEYREGVLAVMAEGASFARVSAATGLSTNTLQRWKREAQA